ncbi:hypothetical protein N7532_006666 [Penicillium argentinense]|uniref:Uncharacterized protein n=1 Tax=Penicillium argentinense TaxID=1131581 RepID=A0A9W9FG84_9EURO|nr:uncharacterized protein N7532_006666 [Penicillium argentinense]KAJ5099665.1 hypothetical protein N7532_006666 [Penicillium argentinense]
MVSILVVEYQSDGGLFLGGPGLDVEERHALETGHDLEKGSYHVYRRDCESACVSGVVQAGTLLVGGPRCLFLVSRRGEHSNRRMVEGVSNSVVGIRDIQKGCLASHAEAIVLGQKHPSREMSPVRSETRVKANVQDSHNDDRYHEDDGPCPCIDHDLDSDETLDLSAGPCHGDRDRCRHSTGLLTPDSCGTQPWRRRQHLAFDGGKR